MAYFLLTCPFFGDIRTLPAIEEPIGLGRTSLGEVKRVVDPPSSSLAAEEAKYGANLLKRP